MDPITNPIPGEWYFGYECRCGQVLFMMRDPRPGEDMLTGTLPEPVRCPYCGLTTSVPPVSWQRFSVPCQ